MCVHSPHVLVTFCMYCTSKRYCSTRDESRQQTPFWLNTQTHINILQQREHVSCAPLPLISLSAEGMDLEIPLCLLILLTLLHWPYYIYHTLLVHFPGFGPKQVPLSRETTASSSVCRTRTKDISNFGRRCAKLAGKILCFWQTFWQMCQNICKSCVFLADVYRKDKYFERDNLFL